MSSVPRLHVLSPLFQANLILILPHYEAGQAPETRDPLENLRHQEVLLGKPHYKSL